MSTQDIINYGLAGFAAAIPIAIWLYILFKKQLENRLYYFWSFLGGILAVALLMGVQVFWGKYPQYDVFAYLTSDIADPGLFFAVTFTIVGVLEEIAKQLLLRYLDTKKAVVKSIDDSIRFSIVAALGFAFAENIFYFHSTYISYGGFTGVLLITYMFRSIFTAAGHMCFSGIFGYFYGMGRFSSSIKNAATLEGGKIFLINTLSRIFDTSESAILRKKLIIKGLLASIILHAIFNFILSLEQVIEISSQIPSILAMVLVSISFSYLYFLRQRQTVETEMLTDASSSSSIRKTPEEKVVEELIANWLSEKKYQDVISTADRLLEKHPNNETVKYIKAQAMDKMRGSSNILDQTITSFIPGHEQNVGKKDESVLKKYGAEKDTNKDINKVEIDKDKDDETYHL